MKKAKCLRLFCAGALFVLGAGCCTAAQNLSIRLSDTNGVPYAAYVTYEADNYLRWYEWPQYVFTPIRFTYFRPSHITSYSGVVAGEMVLPKYKNYWQISLYARNSELPLRIDFGDDFPAQVLELPERRKQDSGSGKFCEFKLHWVKALKKIHCKRQFLDVPEDSDCFTVAMCNLMMPLSMTNTAMIQAHSSSSTHPFVFSVTDSNSKPIACYMTYDVRRPVAWYKHLHFWVRTRNSGEPGDLSEKYTYHYFPSWGREAANPLDDRVYDGLVTNAVPLPVAEQGTLTLYTELSFAKPLLVRFGRWWDAQVLLKPDSQSAISSQWQRVTFQINGDKNTPRWFIEPVETDPFAEGYNTGEVEKCRQLQR